MPRRKRPVSPAASFDLDDDDFDDECGSNRNLPGQRNAANARERARMRILSSAFCRLKTKLPWVPPDTKLSKLDTLKLATTYIQQLGALLAGESEMVDNSMPQNLTWPFHFQQPPDQPKINPSDRSKNTSSTTLPSPTSTSSSSSSILTTDSPNAMDTSITLSPNSTHLAGLNLDNQWLGHHHHSGSQHPHHQLHPQHHHHHQHNHHHSSHHQTTTLLADCNFRETNTSCFNSVLHGQ